MYLKEKIDTQGDFEPLNRCFQYINAVFIRLAEYGNKLKESFEPLF